MVDFLHHRNGANYMVCSGGATVPNILNTAPFQNCCPSDRCKMK